MYDAIAVQVLGTRWTKFFGSPGLLGVSFLEGWSAAQARRRPGGHHGHGRQNQRAARRKCPVLTSKASAAVNLPIVWRAAKNKPAAKKLIFQMATVIATRALAVCNRPHFSIFRAVAVKIGRHLSFFSSARSCSLRPDNDANGRVSDRKISARDIVYGRRRRISLPLPND